MLNIEELFSHRKLRITAMRMLIFRFLAEKKIAVTLSDVEDAFEVADRTTLYRTLKTFEEKGIVHKIDDGTGVIKFALCEEGCNCEIAKDLHLHFHCTKCNQTICLTDYKIPTVRVPDGFIAENVNLVIKGLCNRCSG